jgi:hypothetical protein
MQDIEAEDHILGPLTLRQFIFSLVAVFCFYICFIGITKDMKFLLIPFAPPGLFFAFFAFPFKRDQPTEVWFLAKLRFWFKPRRRIWDQSGIKELVTITVPKKVERVLTDGLSQNEVKSRLSALANTIDSRGWVIKNVNLNAYANPNPLVQMSSDRLIDINTIPQEVPSYDVQASDDILDETSNPLAQQFDQMITQAAQSHRQEIVNKLNDPAPASQPAKPADYWFMHQAAPPSNLPSDQAMFSGAQLVQPGAQQSDLPVVRKSPAPDEAALAAELKAHKSSKPVSYSHLRTLRPLGSVQPQAQSAPANDTTEQPTPAVTAPPDPAILPLVSNNDLSVATLAREAAKAKGEDDQDEVVISLR